MMKKFVLCLLSLSVFTKGAVAFDKPLPTPVNFAQGEMSQTKVASVSELKTLSQSITWHRLLLYKDTQSPKKSTLTVNDINAGFFVSGQFDDPYAELVASIDKLVDPSTRQAFACRFPARTHWLKEQLPELQNLIKAISCDEFDTWKNTLDAKVLTLIHAEEHTRRLGSAFAHTLVKIDNKKSLASKHSDDAYFFNFATDENLDSNAVRTLRGKNPASMTIDKFTEKQASYLRRDERDLWLFELALSQVEIDQIIRHLWEVKDLYRYYNFLDNNCASEILRLIDVADDRYHLTAQAGKIIAPSEVSRVLNENNLLKNSTLQPSRRTLLQIAKDKAPTDDDYYQVMMTGNLPSVHKPKHNPTLSSATHRITVSTETVKTSTAQKQSENTAYTLGFRGAYQDFLDRADGKRKFIYTNIAELNAYYDDKLHLKNATLIDFLSLTPKNQPLAQASYGGHLKLDRVLDPTGDKPLVLSTQAKYGTAWQVGDDGLCYTLGLATAQLGQVSKGYRLGVGADMGCVYHLGDKAQLHAALTVPIWHHKKTYIAPQVSIGGQYDLNQRLGLRLSSNYERAEKTTQKNIQIGAVWYFD